MRTVKVQEAKTHLSALLVEVEQGGDHQYRPRTSDGGAAGSGRNG